MVALWVGSKIFYVDEDAQGHVQSCIQTYLNDPTFESAYCVCRAALPGLEFYASHRTEFGTWMVEVLYDNLVHEGYAEDEATGLLDAAARISDLLFRSLCWRP